MSLSLFLISDLQHVDWRGFLYFVCLSVDQHRALHPCELYSKLPASSNEPIHNCVLLDFRLRFTMLYIGKFYVCRCRPVRVCRQLPLPPRHDHASLSDLVSPWKRKIYLHYSASNGYFHHVLLFNLSLSSQLTPSHFINRCRQYTPIAASKVPLAYLNSALFLGRAHLCHRVSRNFLLQIKPENPRFSAN